MYIVVEGMVRVERKRSDTDDTPAFLGKLRTNDVFGELCALMEESRGVPLRRTRSAYSAVGRCVLMRLSFKDVTELRKDSPSIDAAVHAAVNIIRQNRPKTAQWLDPWESSSREHEVQANDDVGEKLASVSGSVEALTTKVESMASDLLELKALLKAR